MATLGRLKYLHGGHAAARKILLTSRTLDLDKIFLSIVEGSRDKAARYFFGVDV
jgi:hypothetical protein